MPLKVLHTADLHLGTHFPSLGNYGPEREKDFLTTFSSIIKLSLDQKVDLVLIAGDLFDSPHPSLNLFGTVKAELEKLIDANIPIALIPGTHDNIMASDHIYRHPFFEQTILFKEPILKEPKFLDLKEHPIYLYGMAYHPDVPGEYLKNLKRRDMPGIHLGLLHGSIQGSPDWKIYAKDFPVSIDELASLNLDYIALGHYHNRMVYSHEGKIIASYTGTPEGKRFKESGQRYVHLLEFKEGSPLELTPVPINTKTLLEKEIDLFTFPTQTSLAKEILKLSPQKEKTLLRIILKGVTENILDIEKIYSEIAPYFPHVEILDETSVMNSQWMSHLEKENSIRGFFVRRMKEKMDEVKDPLEKELQVASFKEILFEFQKKAELS
ncbi:MAG: hypothetical protein A2Z91_04715 [Deltaproteobacteria bacterium GWA2_38_16]|nr:MAG: hypothetical protein A2Z91_04715 [Deltaproteobacteria bacterium GWA2_38_16]OGQ01695.1 MAG: hypothetical protein A3D19_07465 [Deltaproteobacteria bacterium RIFCSPHIGHO2_02_FULL_38_15]OGQ34175.1 MAG: hypothetical protein A3A72_00355 [Deltaproteobacteria bacterium RIFCSPLOWO2_01_FULL_38_9]OGQ61203.1 MAG: hypothetical protein A3G92_00170 [Deltaproteobacteria bacterium RIFCSPLOWO2_12_FULL_38_8]HBQ21791.1 hypothetical protein [Deltaproteobacteria bacterium]